MTRPIEDVPNQLGVFYALQVAGFEKPLGRAATTERLLVLPAPWRQIVVGVGLMLSGSYARPDSCAESLSVR